ncbi:MAG: caspase domain-containing protein, partial [Saprospiraceae bacterium]
YDEAPTDRKFNKLNNAVLDAASVVEILLEKYKFFRPAEAEALGDRKTLFGNPIKIYSSLKTKCLYNEAATYSNIHTHLLALRKNLTANDNLFLYFAGHGVIHLDESYIMPFDAVNDEMEDQLWFQLKKIALYFDNYSSKNILQELLVVVDACYAGGADLGKTGIKSEKRFSRRILTSSAANQTASDGRLGEGSPFAQAFLRFLDRNTKPFLTIDKGKIATIFEDRKEQKEQQIEYEYLPSNENGKGEFLFELREKNKPNINKLANCLIKDLNFGTQKNDFDKHIYDGKSEHLFLFSTLGYSYDVQKFLGRILLHRLQSMEGYDFSEEFMKVELDLSFFDRFHLDDLWVGLCKQIPIHTTAENARTVFINTLFEQLQSEQDEKYRHVVIWLGYRNGTEELLMNIRELWRELSVRFKEKMETLALDKQLGKLFFVITDQRKSDELFLTQKQFVDVIGDFPKIITTNAIETLRKGHLKHWIRCGKQRIETHHIRNLKEEIFFPKHGSTSDYDLLRFIEKLSEHCEYTSDEINMLEDKLTNFQNPLKLDLSNSI